MPILFFFLGFAFDALMLQRIDELLTIVQQAAYLVVSAILIGVELVESSREVHPPRLIAKVWKYREALLHFLLGTLLNSYTIFYFKSASALASFSFIFLLVGLLVVNEFYRFGQSQTRVHMAFLSLCSISYFVSLAPIVLGFIGNVPFLTAVLVSSLFFGGYWYLFKSRYLPGSPLLRTHILLPFVAIHALFVALYFAHAIPPVPLSVKYMGIYHNVKKTGDEYELTATRSKWRFWEHGDQTFLARPGDTIFCYAQIFSPARFRDQLQVRWLFRNEKGKWVSSDAIPLPIVGGREEGYRGVTKKSNYQPGDWRVQIETMDNREIGRIGFTVISAP